MTQTIELLVPDIGDFQDVPVIEISVAVGDTIAEDDLVILLESDKATLDVPATHGGKIIELKVVEGDTVSEGDVILLLEVGEAVEEQKPEETELASSPTTDDVSRIIDAPKPKAVELSNPQPVTKSATATPPDQTIHGKPAYASPSVRAFARTLGISVAAVSGTGPKGRITREDVQAFVKQRLSQSQHHSQDHSAPLAGLPDWPSIDYEKFGPVERQPLTRIGRLSGPALTRNSIIIPDVCNFDKADVSELETYRKMLNTEATESETKLTMLTFAVKAVVSALKAYPKFNSSLDGDEIVLKNYWNIGVAADTPDGLVVPVIKQADEKGLREIASEMSALAASARNGKLSATDMQGATFTISSLGGIGGTGFTPIINAPEVAILGMTRAEIQPSWDGQNFVPRLIQPLSLSWDHRVVDGVAAARFLAHVSAVLSDFCRILL